VTTATTIPSSSARCSTVPPRVDYAVTELGHTLTEPVRALANWASDNQDAILGHRNAFDETRKQQADGVPVAA
jgi:DNA-binding HxlR family transcriptional regulator